jgi:hypothetical protein
MREDKSFSKQFILKSNFGAHYSQFHNTTAEHRSCSVQFSSLSNRALPVRFIHSLNMMVVQAVSKGVGVKKKRVSKKNKKSWRKHTDTEDVDSFLDDKRLEERLGYVM